MLKIKVAQIIPNVAQKVARAVFHIKSHVFKLPKK